MLVIDLLTEKDEANVTLFEVNQENSTFHDYDIKSSFISLIFFFGVRSFHQRYSMCPSLFWKT